MQAVSRLAASVKFIAACAAVKQLRLENPAASPAVAPPAQRPSIGAAPTSDLLGRLQQFLPAMQSANAQLATAPPAVNSHCTQRCSGGLNLTRCQCHECLRALAHS